MRYEQHELLGEGGTARVYRAWDSQAKRWVAWKRFRPAGPDGLVWRITGTVPTWDHPHLVRYYGGGNEEEDGAALVMEILEGETLDDRIEKRGPVSPTDFCALARHTLAGLGHAHALGFLHGDLKPENVMLCPADGGFIARLFDFTLAQHCPPDGDGPCDEDRTLFGSIFTMAPEQFDRLALDERTDLYSLGCVFYFALTGSNAFTGETNLDVMVAHMQHHVTAIRTHRPELPPALADWVMRLIQRDPARRYANASVAARDLHWLVEPELDGSQAPIADDFD